MMSMKRVVFLLLMCMQAFVLSAQSVDFSNLLEKQHPRLMLDDAAFGELKSKIHSGNYPVLTSLNEVIIANADKALAKETHLERKLSGRRMLSTSREALLRLTSCAFAYRMTANSAYLNFAEGELNAVCSFTDWNHSHFLDVAEMAMGVSVAYDWLYHNLSETTRMNVEKALYSHAFARALGEELKEDFYKKTNNWSSICNSGLVAAVVAVCDKYPRESEQIVQKAVTTNRKPMERMYSPDGAYMEGYSYWMYGTIYEVCMLTMFEQSFGTDFGLSEVPGFLKTGDFILFMEGVAGNFNYSDSGGKITPAVAIWYFADKLGRPELLYNEMRALETGKYTKFDEARLLPLVMYYASKVDTRNVSKPDKNMWYGLGNNPVALMRGDWTSSYSDSYLAVKAGKASNSHGHMDAGSFVYDAYGQRWARDLGMAKYGPIEKEFKKINGNLWSFKQDSYRWRVQRLNNFHHTTITLNNELHCADGEAVVKEFIDTDSERGVVLDMSQVFDGQAESVERTVKILSDNSLMVIDKVAAPSDRDVKYSWRMVTKAMPSIKKDCMELTIGDETMVLKSTSGTKVKYRTWSAEPKEIWDVPNKDVVIVGIETIIKKGSTAEVVVTLTHK